MIRASPSTVSRGIFYAKPEEKTMSSEQHSPDRINRQHVIETSCKFLMRQVSNQRLHVGNLLAKTGDTDSYNYLQEFFKDLEADIADASEEALEEIKEIYKVK